MEGIAGAVAPADVWELGGEFERALHLLTGEVNAAISAAFDCGAQSVLINDAHLYMRNLLVEQLDQRAELIRGSRKQGFMMQGIEEGFDIALFIGYHSMAGTVNGVLCHTFTDHWSGLYINGTEIGESSYNAMYATEYNCPVGVVTGDHSIETELTKNLPWVEHVIVKNGIGRFAAKSLSPTLAQKKIYEGTKRAIEKLEAGELKLYNVEYPVEVQLRFFYPDRTDLALNMPSVERVDALTIKFNAKDFTTLHKTIITLMFLTN